MKKKLILCLGIISVLCGFVFGVNDQPAVAVCDPNATFLGFPAWYNRLHLDNNCTPDSTYYKDNKMPELVWTIVLNIMMDVSIAIGILATAFVIYGGYLYIMSRGEPDKTAKGKTTIRNAIIGIVIAVAAGVIINTVKTILTV